MPACSAGSALVPCGGGFVDGNGGPMQTVGYMTGNMDVVSS